MFKKFRSIIRSASLVLSYGFLLFNGSLTAQINDTILRNINPPDSMNTPDINIRDYLPPLSIMIDSAMENAPEMDYFDAMVETAEYDIILEKKNWSKDLGFSVGYSWSYGNQILDNLVGLQEEYQTRTNTFTTVSLSVPLNTWYGRKDRIERAEAMRKSQIAQYTQAERQVRESVIETYSRLLLLQNLLEVISEARESSDLILQMAEERFREGEITLDQLGQATDLKAQYGTRYAELKTEFSNTYHALERIVGVPFSKFKTENYLQE